MMPNRRVSETAQAMALGILLLTASAIAVRSLMPPAATQQIDTRLQTGTHLIFVLIAPTSNANRELVEAVKAARDSIRSYALRNNYLFSTIAIADNWEPARGIEQLREFGPFDELIVGRNWLNTGVELYVTRQSAPNEVPQVLVVSRSINVDALPIAYGPLKEVVRLSGGDAILMWARTGFRISGAEQKGE